MVRLWNMPKISVISMEKEFDLTARLFGLVTRLMKREEVALTDECLMLPHKVMIPPLDTVQSCRGVGSSLGTGSPLTSTLGQQPDLHALTPTPFIEGLAYTEDPTQL